MGIGLFLAFIGLNETEIVTIGVGITAELIVYPLIKLVTGRVKEVPAARWCLAAVSRLFYVVHP